MPAAPAPPTLNKQMTNRTHAVIEWTDAVSADLSILGYALYADNMGNL